MPVHRVSRPWLIVESLGCQCRIVHMKPSTPRFASLVADTVDPTAVGEASLSWPWHAVLLTGSWRSVEAGSISLSSVLLAGLGLDLVSLFKTVFRSSSSDGGGARDSMLGQSFVCHTVGLNTTPDHLGVFVSRNTDNIISKGRQSSPHESSPRRRNGREEGLELLSITGHGTNGFNCLSSGIRRDESEF